METKDIELRSRKIQYIIGKIPPVLVRYGISIMFLVIVLLLVGSHFFVYPYSVKGEIQISQSDKGLIGEMSVKADKFNEILPGQIVKVSFNNINGMTDDQIVGVVLSKHKALILTDTVAYSLINIMFDADACQIGKNKLIIEQPIKGNGVIYISEKSFFERIFQSILKIFKNM